MGLIDTVQQQVQNQFDNTPGGGIFDPSETTYDLAEATRGETSEDNTYNDTVIDRQFDSEPGGGVIDGTQETAGDAADAATSLAPDWLGPAVIAVLGVVLIGALLWLARPLLTIVSEATA